MSKYFVRYGLAFDPSKSPHYKVVCVSNYVVTGEYRYFYHRGHHDIDIYSSETETREKHLECSSFTSRSDWLTKPMNFDRRSGEAAVYCNGAVHWVRSSPQVEINYIGGGRFKYKRKRCDVLHYFDIGEERTRLVVTPPPLPLCVKNLLGDGKPPFPIPFLDQRYFGESRGHLYLIETYRSDCGAEFEVMEMDKDYSGWFVKYHVDLNPVVSAFPGQDRNAFVVLGIFEEEGKDDEDSSPDLWLHMPGKVVSYVLRTNSLKRSVQLVDKEHFQASSSERSWLHYDYHPYMDSLACV